MENSPLVSICIPAYNAERYIGETINSLLAQTYVNIEIIVSDDSSQDGTKKVLENIGAKNLTVLDNPKKGAASARNFAFNASKGEYIIFFDADDLINEDFIASQLRTLLAEPGSTAVSLWGRFYETPKSFKKDPDIIEKDLTFEEWIEQYWTYFKHTTPPGRVMMPRNVVQKAGLWNEDVSLNDDFEFFTRIFLNSTKIKYNSQGIFYYRSGIGGLSSSNSEKALESYYKTLDLSLNLVLKHYKYKDTIKQACANLWQMFIFHAYPKVQAKVKKAEAEVQKLGGSNIAFPAGGKTKILCSLLGWRLTKRLKRN